MAKLEGRLPEVRIEVVTTTFVASGQPEGIHDLGRFLENLNNPAVSRHIELRNPTIRPLYRAQTHVSLDAPLLVRRDEIVFANFDGPYFTHSVVRTPEAQAPALLMAPPFQIQGTVALAPGADPTQALRSLMHGFFLVKSARVFDADGNALGEGEQVVVNGLAVQMTSSTRRHIEAITPKPATAAPIEIDIAETAIEPDERAERAA
jgi:hypothetical protein